MRTAKEVGVNLHTRTRVEMEFQTWFHSLYFDNFFYLIFITTILTNVWRHLQEKASREQKEKERKREIFFGKVLV